MSYSLQWTILKAKQEAVLTNRGRTTNTDSSFQVESRTASQVHLKVPNKIMVLKMYTF